MSISGSKLALQWVPALVALFIASLAIVQTSPQSDMQLTSTSAQMSSN